MMTINQMRQEIAKAYDGPAWKAKVNNMGDNQVLAVYSRLSSSGKLEEAAKERRRKASPSFLQLSMFDKEYSV